jgi:hypothetical protein
MATSQEQAAEGHSVATPAPGAADGNRFATASLVSGILGITGIGIAAGIVFGILGLDRSRRRRVSGRLRCWIGIIASLAWAGLFVYVVPHVIKAADPGCSAFKESALARYDRAIEDFDARTDGPQATADLNRAIEGVRAAADKSRNATSRAALRKLSLQLSHVRSDAAKGQVPGSVMQALNHDANVADSACGTL